MVIEQFAHVRDAMKIKALCDVIDRFIGGSITVKGVRHPIEKLEERPASHGDFEVFIVSSDGTEFFCGYNRVEGIERGRKFFINDDESDDSLILEPKKTASRRRRKSGTRT